MPVSITPVPADVASTAPAGTGTSRGTSRRRLRLDVLGLLPFAAYVAVFLGAPTYSVVVGAFQDGNGHATTANLAAAVKNPYSHAFIESIQLSAATAVAGALLGLALAFALTGFRGQGAVQRIVTTASGVFAYFGGVPLAFAFIATLGAEGLVTGWLTHIGINLNDSSFVLWSFTGLVIVYLFFQIPLMVLIILPALEGMRPQWQEAALNLGASRLQYWRLIGWPLLRPAFLGAMMLLFANAFAAYATADALTSGSIPLVPIQVAVVMSGNVAANQANLGDALGFGMIVIVAVVMTAYTILQRRAARWLR